MRALILGNSGSGKTTLARRLSAEHSAALLSMDAVAFATGPQRRPLGDSVAAALAFTRAHPRCVMEGCYADIAEALLPECERLLFLNPGVAVCIENCRRRPWEPDKFASLQEQEAQLEALIDWVRRYPERDDEYGLRRHRMVFDRFPGEKRELLRLADYTAL